MQTWVIDMDGVLWLGEEPIPGAADAVQRLAASGDQLLFVTNMSKRTVAEQDAKLERLGMGGCGEVITAGLVAATLVEPGERVLALGGPGVIEPLQDAGAELVHDGPADAVVVGMYEAFDYDAMKRATLAIRAGARFIGTNPDVTFPVEDGLAPGAGAVLASIQVATDVEPTIAGKPDGAVVGFVQERFGTDGIMIGDRPDTDGAFAVALGYDFALVLTGVISEADLPVEPTPQHVFADIGELARHFHP